MTPVVAVSACVVAVSAEPPATAGVVPVAAGAIDAAGPAGAACAKSTVRRSGVSLMNRTQMRPRTAMTAVIVKISAVLSP